MLEDRKTDKIKIPEGYEILEVDMDTGLVTYGEIINNIDKYPVNIEEVDRHYYMSGVEIIKTKNSVFTPNNQFHDKETAEDVLALISVLNLRDAIYEIDDWYPDFENSVPKATIELRGDELVEGSTVRFNRILTFRTREIRDWFLETHRELITKARHLI